MSVPQQDFISFECTCGTKIRVGASMAGKRGKCKACGTTLTVPSPPMRPKETRSHGEMMSGSPAYALTFLASEGRTKEVSAMLADGISADTTQESGFTALMQAAFGGHIETARILLENGADVDLQDNFHGATALMAAATKGSVEIVKMLLDKGADVNIIDNTGRNASMIAATGGHTVIQQLLKETDAKPSTATSKAPPGEQHLKQEADRLLAEALELQGKRELDKAMVLAKKAERICRETDYSLKLVEALFGQGIMLMQLKRPQEGLPLAEEAYRIATQLHMTSFADTMKPILDRLRSL